MRIRGANILDGGSSRTPTREKAVDTMASLLVTRCILAT
jgi:hypothetical protein